MLMTCVPVSSSATAGTADKTPHMASRANRPLKIRSMSTPLRLLCDMGPTLWPSDSDKTYYY